MTAKCELKREMLEDKNGSHIVTISSDKPDLNGIPPHPRPSGPWVRIVMFTTLIQIAVK